MNNESKNNESKLWLLAKRRYSLEPNPQSGGFLAFRATLVMAGTPQEKRQANPAAVRAARAEAKSYRYNKHDERQSSREVSRLVKSDSLWLWAVDIDYDEFHPETYRSLKFYVAEDQPPVRFASGDVIHDYNAAVTLAAYHGMKMGITNRVEDFVCDSKYNRPVRAGGVTLDSTTGLMRPARPDEYGDVDDEDK